MLMRVFYPLVALAVVASAVLFYFRRGNERNDGVEHEPNNTPAYATLLAPAPIRGV